MRRLSFFGMLDKPSERGSLVIKIGLMMYDAYTARRADSALCQDTNSFHVKNHLQNGNSLIQKLSTRLPIMMARSSSPNALPLNLILDAEAENPNAHALNYVSMVGGSEDTIILRDELTDETYDVHPKLVINAAGPWIDFANRKLGVSTRFIGGTKGSHIVVKHDEFRKAIGENEFFFENEDGRIVLIFPLYDRVLIGTSDIPVENPDEARLHG